MKNTPPVVKVAIAVAVVVFNCAVLFYVLETVGPASIIALSTSNFLKF